MAGAGNALEHRHDADGHDGREQQNHSNDQRNAKHGPPPCVSPASWRLTVGIRIAAVRVEQSPRINRRATD